LLTLFAIPKHRRLENAFFPKNGIAIKVGLKVLMKNMKLTLTLEKCVSPALFTITTP
jgi:hypothetical protein